MDPKHIVVLYDQGLGLQGIAAQVGISRAKARRILLESGVLLRWHGTGEGPALRAASAPKWSWILRDLCAAVPVRKIARDRSTKHSVVRRIAEAAGFTVAVVV